MTKVQIRFRLQKPLDDHLLTRISDARDGETKTITVTLGVRPDSAEEVPSR